MTPQEINKHEIAVAAAGAAVQPLLDQLIMETSLKMPSYRLVPDGEIVPQEDSPEEKQRKQIIQDLFKMVYEQVMKEPPLRYLDPPKQ